MKILLVLLLTICANLAEDATLQEFPNAVNSFTPSVYKEVLKTEKANFLVSPFSAATLLALAQSGCRGDTAEEIRQVLHFVGGREKAESAVKEVLSKLTNEEYTLHTANKIYVKSNFSVKEEFEKTAVEVYGAQSENVDFSEKNDAAKLMNAWVEEQTQHKIQNLVDPEILNNLTRVVLINALYFNAKWLVPFPPFHTRKSDFHKSATEVVQVDTMYLDEQYYNYYECHHLDAKLLELPFKGGASLTIVLPNQIEGLVSLESKIKRSFRPHNLTSQLVNVALPKFKIESTVDFKKVLKKLGVKKAFGDEADLSGIAGEKGDLVISNIVQKSFIDVNEEGVEAAAATYIPIILPEMGLPDSPKQFIVDHPFIFYIKVKGMILFAGRVTTLN
jgi:serpin B